VVFTVTVIEVGLKAVFCIHTSFAGGVEEEESDDFLQPAEKPKTIIAERI
jgi:hypothetical protein